MRDEAHDAYQYSSTVPPHSWCNLRFLSGVARAVPCDRQVKVLAGMTSQGRECEITPSLGRSFLPSRLRVRTAGSLFCVWMVCACVCACGCRSFLAVSAVLALVQVGSVVLMAMMMMSARLLGMRI